MMAWLLHDQRSLPLLSSPRATTSDSIQGPHPPPASRLPLHVLGRCFRDHDLKGRGKLSAGSEVTLRDMDDRDAFVIVASAGLWDSISHKEAVTCIAQVCIFQGSKD